MRNVSSKRLELIVTIIEKMNSHPALSSAFQHQLSESLTIAESCLFAGLSTLKEYNDETVDHVMARIDDYCDILRILNVPITTPMSKMNVAQKAMIDSSQPFLETMNQFRDKWNKANNNTENSTGGAC